LDVPVGLISSAWGGSLIEPWICPEGYAMIADVLPGAGADAPAPTSKPKPKPKPKEVDELGLSEAVFGEGDTGWGTSLDPAMAAVSDLLPKPVARRLSRPPVRVNWQAPRRIYNARVHPLVPMAMRGVIWYQGESNGREG
jgi:sialate O-acetylesterase